MSDETFFDLILDCANEEQFILICNSIFDTGDYLYSLSNN